MPSELRDQRILRKLQDQIRANLAKLVSDDMEEIYTDYGNSYSLIRPSLMSQLQDAVRTTVKIRNAKRGRGISLVIAVQAFDLLQSIENETKNWAQGTVVERIHSRACEVCTYTVDKISEIREVAWYLEVWVTQIRNVIDPPLRYNIMAPCPECGERVVNVYQTSEGEYLLQPALQIRSLDGKAFCECVACGAVWPESHFLLLARVLGCDPVA